MSSSPRMAAIAATGKTGPDWGAQVGATGSGGPIDPIRSADFFALDNDRQPMGGQQGAWGGNVYAFDRRRKKQPLFTSYVGFKAAGFIAMQPIFDNDHTQPLFLADLQHAILTYEHDMRIAALWREMHADFGAYPF